MCFAPQWRALFRHLNFKKCSEHGVLLAFSLANVLRATTACNFSSLIWPAGSAPAALASLLFDPPEKHSVSRLSYLFAHLDLLSSQTFSFLIFFLLVFSSLTLPTSAFYLSILSEVWLLNFLRQEMIVSDLAFTIYDLGQHGGPRPPRQLWHTSALSVQAAKTNSMPLGTTKDLDMS